MGCVFSHLFLRLFPFGLKEMYYFSNYMSSSFFKNFVCLPFLVIRTQNSHKGMSNVFITYDITKLHLKLFFYDYIRIIIFWITLLHFSIDASGQKIVEIGEHFSCLSGINTSQLQQISFFIINDSNQIRLVSD